VDEAGTSERFGILSAVLAAAVMVAACGAGERPKPRVGPPGTLALSFEDALGETFVLEEIELAVDGKIAVACSGKGGALDARSPVALWEGSAGPGEHEIGLRGVYRGQGYGIFSYLSGYRFEVKSSHTVDMPPAGFVAVRATAYERGDLTTPVEERPQIRFEETSGAERPSGAIGCPGEGGSR
jgi:hypothetical protein